MEDPTDLAQGQNSSEELPARVEEEGHLDQEKGDGEPAPKSPSHEAPTGVDVSAKALSNMADSQTTRVEEGELDQEKRKSPSPSVPAQPTAELDVSTRTSSEGLSNMADSQAARVEEHMEQDKSDAEPAPKSPSQEAPSQEAPTETTSELDVSASSEALSNMADSLANLAETSCSPELLSTSRIRKMATTLYALAQADTKATNKALEKMADSLASLTNAESEEESKLKASEPETANEPTKEPEELGEVVEPSEEAPVVVSGSIAEIIATTICDEHSPSQREVGAAEVERQIEALTKLVSQEDIVKIANSLAELAGKPGMSSGGNDADEDEGMGVPEVDTSALSTLEVSLDSLVNLNPNVRKRAAETEPTNLAQMTVGSMEEQESSPKRRSYDQNFKLEVVAYAARTSKNEASRRYMVDRKRIQDWTKQKEALEASLHSGIKRKRLEGGGRKAKHPEIEEQLSEWVRSRWTKKEPVSRDLIKREAKRLHQESSESDSFSASEGWLCRFMQRHDISLRSPSQSPKKSPMASSGRKLVGSKSDVVSVQLPWIIDLEPSS